MTTKIKVLFLCVANSCRSQMAEGWARHLGADKVEPYSAGQRVTWVQPNAIRVMRERGVDISAQTSKTVDKVPVRELDYIVTVCAEGAEYCPTVASPAKRIHWAIVDPVGTTGTEEQVLTAFRKTRDEIEKKVKEFLATL